MSSVVLHPTDLSGVFVFIICKDAIEMVYAGDVFVTVAMVTAGKASEGL